MSIKNLMIMTSKDTVDSRSIAAFIDFIFISLLTFILCSVTGINNVASFTGVYAVIVIVYFSILESLTGRTVGKFIFRLQVINDKCSKPNIQQAFIRALFWLFEVNPFLLLGAINFFITKGNEAKQRFGDKLAKTYVVKTKDLKRFLQNPEFQAMESEQFKYEHNKPKFLSYKQDVQGAILNKKVEVIIEGDKTKKIAGLQGMTMDEIMEEINRGGKFVVFKSCVSAIIVSETKESDIYFIKSQEPAFKYHWPVTLKTILLGWWSITGFFWTIDCLRFNFSGGLDVTDVYKIAVSDSLLSKHNRASCYTSEEL